MPRLGCDLCTDYAALMSLIAENGSQFGFNRPDIRQPEKHLIRYRGLYLPNANTTKQASVRTGYTHFNWRY
jgi:hypothetical protein